MERIEDVSNFQTAEEKLHGLWSDMVSSEKALRESGSDELSAFRTYLDYWLSLRTAASFQRFKLYGSLVRAKSHYQSKRDQIINSTTELELATGPNGSWEEREAHYNLKLTADRLLLESAEHLIKQFSDLIRHIDRVYAHWDNRRVDVKWEMKQISRIPASEYSTGQ